MNKLTKQEAIRSHRKMWNWIADETLKRKRHMGKCDYFKEKEIENIFVNSSYCCEYAEQKCNETGKGRWCEYCLFDWRRKDGSIQCINREDNTWKGLYVEWASETTNYKKAAELAREIANLPEKI